MEIETTNRSEFKQFDTTERTQIVRRRSDNLTIGEGKFEVKYVLVIILLLLKKFYELYYKKKICWS